MYPPLGPEDLVAGREGVPSLVVLGSPRCGTTALAAWLSQAGVTVGVKDSFYLMDEDAGLRGVTHLTTHGVPGYLGLFPNAAGPVAECSAGYLYQATALDFFSSWRSAPQFVVVARDPVARLRSVHRYFTGNLGLLPASLGFDEYVDALFEGTVGLPDQTVSSALAQGRYADALEPWTSVFGPDRVHVVSFDALATRPAEVVSRLVSLAGATPSTDLDAHDFETFNASYTSSSAILMRVAAWGRAWIPSGRLRTWGGEKVRRLYTRQSTTLASDVGTVVGTDSRLARYYAMPNRVLAQQYGVDVSDWNRG